MEIKTFDELSTTELYQIIHLREKVFVVEQECVYLDADNNDQSSWHLLHYINNDLAAYLRILPSGITYEYPSIGRVVVDERYRNLQLGREIMNEAIHFLQSKYEGKPIKIGAQTYLNKFYKSLGFENQGDEYLEDGIPHIDMLLVK